MATHASTQTDRQAGRQAGWQAGTQAARQTDRERETGRQPDRETDSQTDSQTNRQAGRQTDRQAGVFASCPQQEKSAQATPGLSRSPGIRQAHTQKVKRSERQNYRSRRATETYTVVLL